MPSENQAGDRKDRLRCPWVVENIGEDPARWLDQPIPWNSDRLELVHSLINGIDTFARLNAWRAVERRLANDEYNDDARHPLDESRERITRRLDRREEWLELHGERPGRLPFGPRESCDCCDADGFVTAAELRERREEEWARRSDGYTATSASKTSDEPETEATALDAFATDGGVDE
ncbi:hypothetical protein [Haloarcula laminariae]|uniref:hypothetical protein n=1 Tax=Haloarcula laminariae TaxID=2961577 RepID=UPI002405B7E2|nr:hypothetical protein [Halomicroarcula sp. FL173]